ncbi:hypothetical protein THAOC_21319 [Thalassiosira oceanica]|uniref:Cytochrome c domain-containing protein n=1 Tax=Thalassiosira oceanica TaxID=159749 RepID=K0SJ97_THAOC|nr:hypothetical protein THAOC_21319 [Thalassiosira oceanica]|eukprot:EJK58547.1 hypothetical protein THAOC_21319 [Thalassiosira oceanica]
MVGLRGVSSRPTTGAREGTKRHDDASTEATRQAISNPLPLSLPQFARYNKGIALAAASTATAGLTLLSPAAPSAKCDDVLHAPTLPWEHMGLLSSYDCASLRRGFQVYRQVCATCHSIERIHYRELVGVTHSTEELVEMASEVEVVDGPNDEGEMFERPAKLTDPLPRPYENEEQGRLANGGAYPPDLSLMVKARHSGQDYLFSLLTGYCDPPAGKDVMPGLYYNPYFPRGHDRDAPAAERRRRGVRGRHARDDQPAGTRRGAIPELVSDPGWTFFNVLGIVFSEDGVRRSRRFFFKRCAEPEADGRKKDAFTYMMVLGMTALVTGYYKRFRWSILKTRSISYVK